MLNFSKPRILHVGIVGAHGLGKTSLMDEIEFHLREHQPGLSVHRVSFADPIREELIPLSGSYTLSKDKNHPYEREALIYTGEVNRRANRNTFIAAFLNDVWGRTMCMDSEASSIHVVLSDDVYHWNEAAMMDLLIRVKDTDNTVPQNVEQHYLHGKYIPESQLQTFDINQAVTNMFPDMATRILDIHAGSPAELNSVPVRDWVLNQLQDLAQERFIQDSYKRTAGHHQYFPPQEGATPMNVTLPFTPELPSVQVPFPVAQPA